MGATGRDHEPGITQHKGELLEVRAGHVFGSGNFGE